MAIEPGVFGAIPTNVLAANRKRVSVLCYNDYATRNYTSEEIS